MCLRIVWKGLIIGLLMAFRGLDLMIEARTWRKKDIEGRKDINNKCHNSLKEKGEKNG